VAIRIEDAAEEAVDKLLGFLDLNIEVVSFG